MIEKCQIFTPPNYVVKLLDTAGYINNLYGKKVVENACGDGNILKEIVRRYIIDSLNDKRSISDIKYGLERDIYGIEIDIEHYTNCLENLNNTVSIFGIKDVNWNIINADFLKLNIEDKFDFVIGNPPYINYRDLDLETRIYLKTRFDSCSAGKFDYCYAFIEASLTCLKSRGKLAYLIPNSIFKNVFAQKLRDLMLPHILKINDYTSEKLFENVLTASAIIVCVKDELSETISYHDVVGLKNNTIQKRNLYNKWTFSDFLTRSVVKRRFGDFFSASICVATLFNKAFILKNYEDDENFVVVGNFRIERNILRKGVSPRSLMFNKNELIIFPYRYINNSLTRYEKDEFEKTFPQASKYLRSYEKELGNRKSDKSVEWFEYGRTQALAHLNQPKLLLSTVVTKKVNVYELSKDSVPYSGIYIIPKSTLSLSEAKRILESEPFYKYVQNIGTNANGSSLRITPADINDYKF